MLPTYWKIIAFYSYGEVVARMTTVPKCLIVYKLGTILIGIAILAKMSPVGFFSQQVACPMPAMVGTGGVVVVRIRVVC